MATVRELGWTSRLRDTGVGGVVDHSQLKCLHAHLGHHLATAASAPINPAGSWVALALRERLSDVAAERQRKAHQARVGGHASLKAADGLDDELRSTALALLESVPRSGR